MAVVILVENGDSPATLTRLCDETGVRYTIHYAEHFDIWESIQALQELVAQIDADWVLHADSDEFLREVGCLRDVLTSMQFEGADHACGWMCDRLASDGRLAAITPVETVEQLQAAFPIRAAVTEGLARGFAYKVCLSRWPDTGQIHAKGGTLCQEASSLLTLDHFKWRTGLEARLRKRMADHAQSGLPWGNESQRILDELQEHGRIRAEHWPVADSDRFWLRL